MSSDFITGIVYSAAQIIQAHDQPTIAEGLLNTAVRPTDDLTDCAEYDLAILRKALPNWSKVPAGK